MKISSGVAEIFLGRNPKTGSIREKTYIWPDYRQNAVEKIRGREAGQDEYIFRKPGPKAHEELLGAMQRVDQSYDSTGRPGYRKAPVARGSFFDALA